MSSSPIRAMSNRRSGELSTRTYRYTVGEDGAGERLDRYLAGREPPGLSRSQVKKFLEQGEITVDDRRVKAGYRLRCGDQILWEHTPPPTPTTAAQPIDIDVLYEDDDLAVVDKPAGLVVHPAPGHPDGTLVNALKYHFQKLSSVGGDLRPGIVHRLDKDTSGALAVAKTDRAHRYLADQFRARTADRLYHAIVFGPGLDSEGSFQTGHARHPRHRVRYTGDADSERRAITHYRVVERFDSGACLVECRLETGRTHQIRMHFYEANAPVLGDHLYGGDATSSASIIDRQALHALTLGIEHPDGHRIECRSEYPADFQRAVDRLRSGADWR